jgi:predicted RNA methylase
MTAGVGGLCFKAVKFFDQVDAYELDEHRCELLRRNSENKGLGSPALNCFCADSLHALLLGTKQPLPAAIFDPPWGGLRRDKEAPILFNDLELHEVIISLIGNVRTLGLKLPVNYNIQEMKRIVGDHGVKVVLNKNIGRQFFVVLLLPLSNKLYEQNTR